MLLIDIFTFLGIIAAAISGTLVGLKKYNKPVFKMIFIVLGGTFTTLTINWLNVINTIKFLREDDNNEI